jgi:hypothetical protein
MPISVTSRRARDHPPTDTLSITEKDKQQPAEGATAASPPADQAITNVTTATGAAANSAPTTQNPGPSPDPEKQPIGGPVDPGTDEPDPVSEETRRRTLIVHLRLAKFFSWLLLLAFVILPGTFSREQQDSKGEKSTKNVSAGALYVPSSFPFDFALLIYHVMSFRPFSCNCWLLAVVSMCDHRPTDSRLSMSVPSSMPARLVGSGISGGMTMNSCTSTSSYQG